MLRLFLNSMILLMVGMGCGLISQLLLAKFLSAEQYGIYSFVLSLSVLVSVFSLLGFQNGLVRFIPVYLQSPEKGTLIGGLFSYASGLSLITGIVLTIIVFSGLYMFGYAEKYGLMAFVIGVALVPFLIFMRLNAAFLRGHGQSAWSVFYESSLREIIFLSVIIGALILGWALGLSVQALCILLLVQALVCAVSYIHIRRYLFANALTQKPDKAQKTEWLKVSFPMMLVIFAQRLMRRSDIIILGLMVNPALVGIYALAAQFSETTSAGQKVVQSVFSPRAADYYERGDVPALKKLYGQNLLFSIVSTGTLCTGVIIIFPYITAFLGSEFEGAYTALMILLIGHFLMILMGPAAALLAMSGYEQTIMKITALCALGNVVLNVPFIYLYGLEGAAMVTAFFLVFRNALSYLYVRRYNILEVPKA